MSKRIDNIVNELTNYIEEQAQTEIETTLGVKHRKDIAVPMFCSLCFICKDGDSVNILANYLQNNMGFSLTYKDGSERRTLTLYTKDGIKSFDMYEGIWWLDQFMHEQFDNRNNIEAVNRLEEKVN